MESEHANDDPAMSRVRELWESHKMLGMTQEQLGVAMGYGQKSARKSVSQFLRTNDPRISMLRKFAKAVDVPLSQIIQE
jgi:transcriptional regulator with XRE-family HTH domain